MRDYIKNLLIAIDQLGNAVLAGQPDITISSRVGISAVRGNWWALHIFEPAINLLMYPFDGANHCRRSIEWDEYKAKSRWYYDVKNMNDEDI